MVSFVSLALLFFKLLFKTKVVDGIGMIVFISFSCSLILSFFNLVSMKSRLKLVNVADNVSK